MNKCIVEAGSRLKALLQELRNCSYASANHSELIEILDRVASEIFLPVETAKDPLSTNFKNLPEACQHQTHAQDPKEALELKLRNQTLELVRMGELLAQEINERRDIERYSQTSNELLKQINDRC
jgi:hypothetical protein